VLTDGENAILFPPRSPKVLAEKIDSVLDQPELCQKIAARGTELVRNHYNYDTYAAQMEAAFAAPPGAELPEYRP
jgi:glycosyltransferase involved in cell wall biosynthesis